MHARLLVALVLLVGVGVVSAAQTAPRHDYPTQTRVEYVLGCMKLKGGQNYTTMYGCVCAIDRIAEHLDYDEYVQAEMLGFLLGTPGERGGLFRDATPDARDRAKRFEQVRVDAEAACFVN